MPSRPATVRGVDPVPSVPYPRHIRGDTDDGSPVSTDAQNREEELRWRVIAQAERILVARDGVSIAEANRALRAHAKVTKTAMSEVAMSLLIAQRGGAIRTRIDG